MAEANGFRATKVFMNTSVVTVATIHMPALIERAGDRTPGLEQRGVARDQIDAALHEHPLLADAAAAKLVRELETA